MLVISLIAIFTFMEIAVEKKIIKLFEKIEEDIVRVDLFIYKSYLNQVKSEVLKRLKRKTLSIHDLEEISRNLKDEDTVYVLWTDMDGNVLYQLGELYSEEDIYEDSLYQAVLYGEEEVLMTDIYPLERDAQT